MKIWIGGNIDSTAIEEYRVARNTLEKKINEIIEKEYYTDDINSLDITFFIHEEKSSNEYKYSKKNKETDIEIYLNTNLFLKEENKERIILNNIINSVNELIVKFKLKFDLVKFEKDLQVLLKPDGVDMSQKR